MMGQIVMQKEWFAIFKVKVTVKVQNQMWLFLPYIYDSFYHSVQLVCTFCSQIELIGTLSYSSVFCVKTGIVVFRVKVTVKVQIFIGTLSVLSFLYHWSFCNQTRYVEVLSLINWVQQSGLILTVIRWLTVSLGTQLGVGVFCCARRQPCCFCSIM